MISLKVLDCIAQYNANFGNFIYSLKNYKLQIFLLGFYQFNIGLQNWFEIILEDSLRYVNADNEFLIFNQENFWRIISGELSPHFNSEIEKLYYQKLSKYIARHPKTKCFAISQVIDDFGRDY